MKRLPHYAAALLATMSLAACSADQSTSPLDLNPLYAGEDGDIPAEVEICKNGPVGTTATFSITQSPTGVGTLVLGSQFTLDAALFGDLTKCRVVWRASSASQPATTLTITEVSSTGNTVLNEIVVIGGVTTPTINLAGKTTSFGVNWDMGAFVSFKNVEGDTPPPPPPPPGGRGCTPGYWKVKPHLDSWPATGYATNQSFVSAFGVNAFPGMTLHQVVSQGGGQLKALGRHAVAALLNSAHPSVAYDLTTANVISAFQAAHAAGSYEVTKSIFETLNELGCPIN